METDSLVSLLRRHAEGHPDRVALVHLPDGEAEDVRWTYADLDSVARRMAERLLGMAPPGARVMIACPEAPGFVASLFACAYAGLVAVPTTTGGAIGGSVPGRIAADSRARVVLTSEAELEGVSAALSGIPQPPACLTVDALLDGPDGSFVPAPVSPHSEALVQYTSGSTRKPRGVVIRHANIIANQRAICTAFGHDEQSTFVTWLPLFHDMGLIGSVLQPLFLGSCCVIMPPHAFLASPARWLRAIHRYRARTSGAPSFGYQLCAARVSPSACHEIDLSSWRVAFNGAEPVRADVMDAFTASFRSCGFRPEAFCPCYGLAEATLFVSGRRGGTGATTMEWPRSLPGHGSPGPEAHGQPTRLVSVGRAWEETEVAIVDPSTRRPCHEGTVGEVWVSGPSVASGYHDRPDETAATFGARTDPVGSREYLRTGDLGFVHDGELYVTGRLKDLIILRGVNHHPHELEWAAERSHTLVRPGCCAAFAVAGHPDDSLVVCAEVRRRARPSVYPDIAEAIVRSVAVECGVTPDEVVLLGAGSLTKTTSGKLRRQSYRDAYLAGAMRVFHRHRLSPGSDGDSSGGLEDLVRQVVAQQLGISPGSIGPDQPLVRLGIDSIGLMRLLHRLEDELDLRVPLAEAMRSATVRWIAGYAERDARTHLRQGLHPTTDVLSAGELALFLDSRRASHPGQYNVAIAVRLRPGDDSTAVADAVDALVECHAAFRTSFEIVEGVPRRRVGPFAPGNLAVVDAARWDAARLQQEIRSSALRAFDLESGPPFRAVLFTTDEGDVLLLAAHHIIADHWSLEICLRDLRTLDSKARSGSYRPLTQAPDMAQYVAHEQASLTPARQAELEDYWRRTLDGVPVRLNLLADRPPARRTGVAGVVRASLPPPLVRAVEATARAQGVSDAVVLLSVYAWLLHRYSSATSVVVGIPWAKRAESVWADLVGYLVNLLPVRCDFDPAMTFHELIARTDRALANAVENGLLPFAQIVRTTPRARGGPPPALVQAVFVMQPAVNSLAGDRQPLVLDPIGTGFELELAVTRTATGLDSAFVYDAGLFEPGTARSLHANYIHLLAEALAAPSAPLGSIAILPPGRDALRYRPEVLPDRFSQHAELAPDRRALTLCGREMTYGELNARSNALAWRLREHGVGPETPVALLGERSFEAIIALLGILKAGGAYVPVRATTPALQVASLLGTAKVRLAVNTDGGDWPLPSGVTEVTVDQTAEALAPPSRTRPGNLAYLIRTSGSTGAPKIVGVEHRQVCQLLRACQPLFRFDGDDVWSQFHSLSFDFSVWEVFGALSSGGRLVLLPEAAVHSPETLLGHLAEQSVTVLNLVPTAFRELAHASIISRMPPAPSLRLLIFGGEPLHVPSLLAWADNYGVERPRLVNMYGITETTVHVTSRVMARTDLEGPPRQWIGTPLPHLCLHILDREGDPVPPGVCGEIYVGGEGVSRGYFGRADVTADRFLPDPFSDRPGGRLYRTGDLGRLSHDGEIEFLGRCDRQVQVRGHRVEPAEVEEALRAHPLVRDAVVVGAPMGDDGAMGLIAYTEPIGVAPAVDELRDHLAGLLPFYMTPARIIHLDSLPRTPGGKVDRASLPPPAGARPALAGAYKAPATEAETILCAAVADCLGLDQVGTEDDFFALGGDSIRALQVASRCRGKGLFVSVEQLYRTPRIRDLARVSPGAGPCNAPETLSFALVPTERVGRLPEGVVDAFPASSLQRLIYERSRAGYGHECYVSRFLLGGTFCPSVLRHCVELLTRRHAMLRTTFDRHGGELWQRVHEAMPAVFVWRDLRAMDASARTEFLNDFTDRQRRAEVNWGDGPLFAFHAHQCADDAFEVSITETLLDGWSVSVLVAELIRLYSAACQAATPPDLPPVASFSRFVSLERQATGDESFWRPRIEELPNGSLPFVGRSRRLGWGPVRRLTVAVASPVTDRLVPLAREHSLSLKHLLLAAHLSALETQTEGLPVVTAVITNGRPEEPHSDRTLGLFLNTLPLRISLGRSSWLDVARRCQSWERDVMPHRRTPFARLQEWRETPLCESVFNYTHFHEFGDLAAGPGVRLLEWSASDQTYFPLTFQFNRDAATGQLRLGLDYDPARVDPEVAQRSLTLHLSAIERLIQAPETPCAGPERRPPGGLQCNVVARVGAVLPPEPPVTRLIDEVALRAPMQTAILNDTSRMDFRSFVEETNRLAQGLVARGIGSETPVGLALERSPASVVAFVAVLKAGASVVPLDIRQPHRRLRDLTAVSGTRWVITDAAAEARLPGERAGWNVIDLDALREETTAFPADAPDVKIRPNQVAYILGTSGSTGRPKAVMGTHEGLSNRIRWMERLYPLTDDDVFAVKTSVAFVDSLCEILAPLCRGVPAALIRPEVELDAHALVRQLTDLGATRIVVVPSLLRALMGAVPTPPRGMPRFWVSSGEPLPSVLVQRFRGWLPEARLLNLYGSTEVTADATWFDTSQPFDTPDAPIGAPIDGMRVLVLDPDLNPLPTGVTGEIYVGGVGIARGYAGDPGATARAFLPEIFPLIPGGRMYRTGDLGRCARRRHARVRRSA